MAKPTLFLIFDSETTKKNGLVFDMSWELIDRKGKIYDKASFLCKDVLRIDDPFYKDKISDYWLQVFKGLIKPHSFRVARKIFNDTVHKYQKAGYRVIFCAYNAAFDVGAVGNTSLRMVNKRFCDHPLELMDLWHNFCLYVPKVYADVTEKSEAGNYRTSAEAAFRFITCQPSFEEKHIAHSDVVIERQILNHILKRKRKLFIVDNPKKFVANPWKIAKERLAPA